MRRLVFVVFGSVCAVVGCGGVVVVFGGVDFVFCFLATVSR